MISCTFSAASPSLVSTRPSGRVISTPAPCSVTPPPRSAARIYFGFRLMVYSLPPQEKVRVTLVGMSSAAYLERSISGVRAVLLALP